MVTYSEKEMIGITELSRSLNNVVENISNHTIEKMAIFKNNKPKVVMLSFKEYQRMKELSDMQEYHTIADIVEKRLTNSKPEDFISEEELLLRLKNRGLDV